MTEYNLDRVRRKESAGTGVFAMAKGCVDVTGARERSEFGLSRVVAHAEEAVGVEAFAIWVNGFFIPHEIVGEDDLGSFGDDGAV